MHTTSFGTGYNLMVKVKPLEDGTAGDTAIVREYIEKHFTGSVLKEEHYGELHFQVFP